jgi:uncharacterized DUF497 family protein
MIFDWDEANADHVAQHGVTPAQVEQVFENSPEEKKRENRKGEDRFVVMGPDNDGRVIIVVATMRDEKIRPVTAYPVHRRRG